MAASRSARGAPGSQRVEDAITRARRRRPAPGDARRSIADARDQVARARGGSTRTKTRSTSPEADAPLYAALVDWRLRQSRAAERARLRDLPQHDARGARHAPGPASTRALLDVPGVGPVKAERYGEAVLALVAEHARIAPVAPTG